MKTAIVLYNLGGPDSLDAVKPFLRNLFSDPAIIGAPTPVRWALARLISSRREKYAQDIYAQMGGKSPINEETEAQAKALESALKQASIGMEYKVFFFMRYWKPFAEEVAEKVKAFAPDKIVLLPLYPQFTTTTTESAIKAWNKAAQRFGINAVTSAVCCYPAQSKFVESHARLLEAGLQEAGDNVRVLFSAHGLPEKVVNAGDPYQWQVERTVAAIVERIRNRHIVDSRRSIATTPASAAGSDPPPSNKIDYSICYQSRVGPLKWIGPDTADEIRRAGRDGKRVVLVPVAFVSEHSETLVELDIMYKELAAEASVPKYVRVPALRVDNLFIEALKEICLEAEEREGVHPCGGKRICPKEFGRCLVA